MSQKRGFCDDGLNSKESKRLKNDVRDVLGTFSTSEFAAGLEPFLRRVVREEVERVVARYFQGSTRFSFDETKTSRGCGFMLQFVNKIPATIFTGSKIETEDRKLIEVRLVDAITKAVVTTGPLSSMKIEIVALNGDFGSDDREDWSESEFASSIIREREGRRPLVTGELNITLKDGVGRLADVSFTDNSCWQRSRKFVLGAKPMQKVSDNIRIREARSGSFVVKDHRGELYKKHYPPSLNDEVWRLDKISKGGAFHRRLASREIHSVGDFLRSLEIDPSMLRNTLSTSISERMWETIVKHALTCELDDDKLYSYQAAGQCTRLLFNTVYKVVGASFEGQHYKPLHELSPPEKVLVDNMKQQAHKNVKDFVPIDARSLFGPSRTLTSLQADPFHYSSHGLQLLELTPQHEDQLQIQQLDCGSASTSYAYDMGSSSHLEFAAQSNQLAQGFPSIRQSSFNFRDIFPINSVGDAGWIASASHWGTTMTSDQETRDSSSLIQTSTWSPANPTWGQSNAFFFHAADEPDFDFFAPHPSLSVHMSRIESPRTRWCKIRAAFSVRSAIRDVAIRRISRSLCM